MAHRLAQEVDLEYDPHFAESTVRTIYEAYPSFGITPANLPNQRFYGAQKCADRPDE
jgi:hypothetical protein